MSKAAKTVARTIQFLRVSEVKNVNLRIEKTTHMLLDGALLESAINSPINQQHYGKVEDMAQLAATLSSRIIRNHAFANGNKRTGLLAANRFLVQNGKMPQKSPLDVEENDKLEEAHNKVAMGILDEEELAKLYRASMEDTVAAPPKADEAESS